MPFIKIQHHAKSFKKIQLYLAETLVFLSTKILQPLLLKSTQVTEILLMPKMHVFILQMQKIVLSIFFVGFSAKKN